MSHYKGFLSNTDLNLQINKYNLELLVLFVFNLSKFRVSKLSEFIEFTF